MVNRLYNYFNRLHFSKPSTSDVVVFDETNASLVQSVIPKGLTASIVKMRPMEFHITPSIVVNFFKFLKNIKFKNTGFSNRSFFNIIFWQLLCIYIKADIVIRNPKIIITSIDNSSKFAWLSEHYEFAPCVAIQNGFRLSYDANPKDRYYCQHLFCFGQREIIDFPKMNYRVDNFYPVGSLNLSLNFDEELTDLEVKYDLLIVSCWRGNIGYARDVQDSMKAMRIMDEKLASYLGNRNIRAAVILRSERDSDHWFMPEVGFTEESYYKSIYGDLIEIIDVNFAQRNVYSVMQRSEVILAGFSTTCLIEAYAMGKKILYINFCGDSKYHSDFTPEILFAAHDDKNLCFDDRLDALFEIMPQEYVTRHKERMEFYMQDPRFSPRDRIRRGIQDIIATEHDQLGP